MAGPWEKYQTQSAPATQGPPPFIPGTPKAPSAIDQHRLANDDARLQLAQNADTRAQQETQQKLQKAKTSVLTSFGGAASKIDNQIKHIDELLNHPGLSHITGPLDGRLPTWANDVMSLSADPEGAQALVDQIGSAATIAELQDMRASSPTGGALGSVSNYEDQMLRSAAARLKQSQSDAEFKKSLKDYRAELEATKSRLTRAYTNDFGEPPPQAGPAPAKDGWKIEQVGN